VIIISYVKKARNCVVCGKEFNEQDDVVFCPECGAPHHRECWKEQGHCYYEAAHGTDLQWHPKEEEEPATQQTTNEPTDSSAPKSHNIPTVFVFNGTPMTRCPHCGKMTQGQKEDYPCPHCGEIIQGLPEGFEQFASQRNGNLFGNATQETHQPVDGIDGKKMARVVMQKASYYLPQFRALKKQGTKITSWNWAAFLISPYWFAFRKCYLWSVFSAFFDLLALVLMLPITSQMMATLDQNASYMQLLETAMTTTFSPTITLLAQGGLCLLLLRSILFGIFGNYIYKTECIKRIQILDAMSAEEANARIFRIGGVSLFAPILVHYGITLAQNLILQLF
jgi:Zn finger protein HypA/HybF involved in hydrogenase expression